SPDRFGRGPGQSRGLALNGIVFEGPAPTDAILGAYTLAPFDDAGGHIHLHAGYHYHAATGVSTALDQDDGHAPMIGYAMDGYAMFARLDAEGNEAIDLDECRGHVDDVRGYHYHVADAGTNSFLGCFRGARVAVGPPPR
ncbi:YHYH protein, partial [bacterium]|nr:YHYH protein [bacterium]